MWSNPRRPLRWKAPFDNRVLSITLMVGELLSINRLLIGLPTVAPTHERQAILQSMLVGADFDRPPDAKDSPSSPRPGSFKPIPRFSEAFLCSHAASHSLHTSCSCFRSMNSTQLLALLLCYAIGCVVTAWYVVKWRTGADLRTLHSGTTGARNAGRVLGRWGFAIIALLEL